MISFLVSTKQAQRVFPTTSLYARESRNRMHRIVSQNSLVALWVLIANLYSSEYCNCTVLPEDLCFCVFTCVCLGAFAVSWQTRSPLVFLASKVQNATYFPPFGQLWKGWRIRCQPDNVYHSKKEIAKDGILSKSIDRLIDWFLSCSVWYILTGLWHSWIFEQSWIR